MKNSIKKILLFHSSNDLYGSSKIFLKILDVLKDDYLIETIIPKGKSLSKKIISKKIKTSFHDVGIFRKKFINFFGLINRLVINIRYIFYLVNYIKKNRINLVYINTSVILSPAIAATICGIPTLLHVHETFDFKNPKFFIYGKILNLFIDYYFLVSKTVKTSWYSIISKKNFEIIENGFEFLPIFPKNRTSKKIIVSKVARIMPRKGIFEFIKISHLISKKIKNIEFHLYGDSLNEYVGYKNKLISYVRENKLGNTIKFMGFNENIQEILNKSSFIFHLPIETESLPTLLIEAISNKKPVIVSNNLGNLEVLENGNNGLVLELKSLVNDTESIIKYFLNKKKQSNNIKNAYSFAKKKYDLEIFNNKILSKVSLILDEKS